MTVATIASGEEKSRVGGYATSALSALMISSAMLLGHLRVVIELHRVDGAALRVAPQVGRVAEHLGERNEGR